MKNKLTFKKAVSALLWISILFSFSLMLSCASDSVKPITEATYSDEQFRFTDSVLLCTDGDSSFYFSKEKKMYAVNTYDDDNIFTTYLDQNGNSYFAAYDKQGNLCMDFPNDSNGLVVVREAKKFKYQDEEKTFFVDSEGNEYFFNDSGDVVKSATFKFATDDVFIDENGNGYFIEDGNVITIASFKASADDIIPAPYSDQISEEQALKVAVLSIMQKASIEKFEAQQN